MKKIMIVMALIGACFCGNAYAEDTVVDVYDYNASLSVPYLNSGTRTYKTQKMTGKLYMEYASNTLASVTLVMQNKKTKVEHQIDMTDYFYNLMGKSGKNSYRNTPTVFFTGSDTGTTDGHEHIVTMSMAGSGSLKKTNVTTVTCNVCSDDIKTTSVCMKLSSMSGSIVGVMDCQCPEDEEWNHTLIAGPCGVVDGELEDVRSHNASFKGTWTAKWNKKESAKETELAN